MRVTEQQVLLDAVTAYMNLLRDQAIYDLDRRNVIVLVEQLRQTRDRFQIGELTRTDVSQAETRLAISRFTLLNAEANQVTSQANYRRVIGVDPGRLAPGVAGRPVFAEYAAERDRRRSGEKPIGSCRKLRRRRRCACRQNQRRRALSDLGDHSGGDAGRDPAFEVHHADQRVGARGN